MLQQVNDPLAPAFWKQNYLEYEGWISEDKEQGALREGYCKHKKKRSELRLWQWERKEGKN